MKHYLFIDNFRGFRNTWVPITDVNFLVGENSTGKTSVMSLLKLLSGLSVLLQHRQEFVDEDVDFGHFSDMVSAHSNDRSYFHVGLVGQFPGKKGGEENAIGSLCTYVEDQGLPRLSSYKLYRDSNSISLRFSGNRLQFKTDMYQTPVTAENIIDTLVPKWLREPFDNDTGYEKLDTGDFPESLPIVVALALVRGVRTDKPIPLDFGDVRMIQDLAWLAPIRTKPRRTYDKLTTNFSPDGSHTPYLIRSTLSSKKEVAFRAFIHKVGKSSGLFQDIQIKNFGDDITAPFEVDVVLDGKALNLSTVGYGVSQSLPVLVELLVRPPGTWFAIQQPEVHLHPRAQAALGDVIFDMATRERKRFLVETHSDFTIDRFRMNHKEKKSTKPDSQILFFERRDKHNIVTPLQIGDSGELPSDQPEGYRKFFVREELRLLGVE